MGHQFIHQPNGKWAIWSSIVDDFIWLDCEPWDLFSTEAFDLVVREYDSCRQEIENLLDPNGRRRFTQMTWGEALEFRAEVHQYGPCEDEPDSTKGDPDFKEDPFEGLPIPELNVQPKMDSIDDFFRLKFLQLTEFYYWFKQEKEVKGWEDPPSGYDQRDLEEPRRTALRHKHTLQHYTELLRYFAAGKLTNPLCPHCKKIVSEEGEVCERCKESRLCTSQRSEGQVQ